MNTDLNITREQKVSLLNIELSQERIREIERAAARHLSRVEAGRVTTTRSRRRLRRTKR